MVFLKKMAHLMLVSVFVFPVVGILLLFKHPRKEVEKLRVVALEWSLLTLTATILLWCSFDGEGQFQGVCSLGVVNVLGPIVFAVDGVSIFFLILTALLIPVCILISWSSIKILVKEFLLCLLAMEVLLIGVFTVLDLVGFYILFEAILIPMFLIIGIWGSREEKVRAAYYFFFYTFVGSVFLLLGILILYNYGGTTDYRALCCLEWDIRVQYVVFVGFFFSLAVKIPKMPFHIWLPHAHVEAPVAGSVILAGVLLKLGGYGFIRFSWALFPEASEFYSPLIQTLSLLAVIYGSLTTCRQIDLKRVIAYSSIAHMGLVTLGVFTHTVQGLVGSIYLMLAHGLVSSALFIMVTLLYERHLTRLVKYYRGMAITMPLFGGVLLTLVLANIGLPLSCNFMGEFITLLSAFEYSYLSAIVAALGMVLSAAYGLYMFNRVCFGNMTHYLYRPRDLNRREFFSVLPLIVLTYYMGIFPAPLLDTIQITTSLLEI